MGCNCGGRRNRTTNNPTAPLVDTVDSKQQWRVTYSNGSEQLVPDERTARAIQAVNGGHAEPVEPPAPSAA